MDVEVKARVEADVKEQLEAVAARRREKTSVVVREAIHEYLERNTPWTRAAVRYSKKRKPAQK